MPETLVKTIYVYDDKGTLASAVVNEFDSEQEAAVSVIDALIEWTHGDGHALYSNEQCQAHLAELTTLKVEVVGCGVNVMQQAWFESLLGFTFSFTEEESEPTCGQYTDDAVLPNENHCCSLRGSNMNEAGECSYAHNT